MSSVGRNRGRKPARKQHRRLVGPVELPMSDRQFLARAAQQVPKGVVGRREPLFMTDPGCDAPAHREAIYAAMMTLHSGRRVSSPQTFSCGCVLTVVDQ